MADKCECKANCDHHRGKACPADTYTVQPEWVIDEDEHIKGHPVSLRYCLLCMLKQEEARKAEAAKKPAL